jgi:sulfate transport system permease protein
MIRRAEAGTTESAWVRYTLIGITLIFLFLFLVLPLAAVFAEALRKGFDAYWEAPMPMQATAWRPVDF